MSSHPRTASRSDPADAGTSRRTDRIAVAVVVGIAGVLGVFAVLVAAGSFLSYASVKARLDAFASDGDADVTHADFDAIVVRLRVAAIATALAAAGVYAARKRLGRLLAELARSAAVSLSSLRNGLGAALAAESRLHLGALGAVTLVGALVRLDFLFQPMRYDESVTYVHYASRPWYIALTTYTAPNNHVLHSLFVHFSTLVFGGAPWAIRLPAFLAGVLLVPASYLAARAVYERDVALLTAGLVAGSSVLVEYSTNARGYTLVALVFVLLLALASRLCASPSPAEWLAFAVLAAIGFATVPVMLYGFGTVVVWLGVCCWAEDRALIVRRLLPAVLTTAVLTLLFYLPIAASTGVDALVANEFVRSLPWATFAGDVPDSLVDLVRDWHRDIPWPLAVVLGAAFVAGVFFHRRLSRFALAPALAALVWIVPLVVAQRVVPFERVWLFLVPVYSMTAAVGLVLVLRAISARVGGEGVASVVVALAVAGALAGSALATRSVSRSEDTSTFRDGAAVAALVANQLHAGDKVVVAPPADAILEYWLGRRGLDPTSLLYWRRPGSTRRFLVVVKEGPRDYALSHLLADPRLEGVRLRSPHTLRRFREATVYEVSRSG